MRAFPIADRSRDRFLFASRGQGLALPVFTKCQPPNPRGSRSGAGFFSAGLPSNRHLIRLDSSVKRRATPFKFAFFVVTLTKALVTEKRPNMWGQIVDETRIGGKCLESALHNLRGFKRDEVSP